MAHLISILMYHLRTKSNFREEIADIESWHDFSFGKQTGATCIHTHICTASMTWQTVDPQQTLIM